MIVSVEPVGEDQGGVEGEHVDGRVPGGVCGATDRHAGRVSERRNRCEEAAGNEADSMTGEEQHAPGASPPSAEHAPDRDRAGADEQPGDDAVRAA